MYVAEPPDIEEIMKRVMQEHDAGRVARFLVAGREAGPVGEYIHWDKLRHLTPPSDLSHEEWWLTIKFAREQSLQKIPLRDTTGHAFSYGTPPRRCGCCTTSISTAAARSRWRSSSPTSRHATTTSSTP